MEKCSKIVVLSSFFCIFGLQANPANHDGKTIVPGPTENTVDMSMDTYKKGTASPLDVLRAAHSYHGGYNEYVWERMYARQGKVHVMNYSHPAFYDPKLYG